MSYAAASALQEAIYQALVNDAAVAAITNGAIYDAVPAGQLPPVYVTLGPEQVRERGDVSGGGAEHRIELSVVSDGAGFGQAKSVATAISDALHAADLTLSRGRLVFLNFERAVAKRDGAANLRRIDLRFLARVEAD